MLAVDESVLPPAPAGSIAPPPAPRQLSPAPAPKDSLIPTGDNTAMSQSDELGRREPDEDNEYEQMGVDDEEADREALANARYGDVKGDPYAGLGDAFRE